MEVMNSNGTGAVEYTEFLAATLDRKLYSDEDVCRAAFRVFDRDGDGQIGPSELKHMLSTNLPVNIRRSRVVSDIIKEVDENGDGMIDFQEFMHMMQQGDSPCHHQRYFSV